MWSFGVNDRVSNLKTFERFLGQENALVLASDPRRVPFVVDPANACTTWLKTFLAKVDTCFFFVFFF